ncbi:hypothetical protein ABZV60_10065 [Streptomyces sp. NPDC004787]|uniref:hypothetical protein n=1 Tax=Streptomyces sp. NPDC004787 TaxID=3154291 RepID=UPI0033BA443F
MPADPFAVLHALLRAEAARTRTPEPPTAPRPPAPEPAPEPARADRAPSRGEARPE